MGQFGLFTLIWKWDATHLSLVATAIATIYIIAKIFREDIRPAELLGLRDEWPDWAIPFFSTLVLTQQIDWAVLPIMVVSVTVLLSQWHVPFSVYKGRTLIGYILPTLFVEIYLLSSGHSYLALATGIWSIGAFLLCIIGHEQLKIIGAYSSVFFVYMAVIPQVRANELLRIPTLLQMWCLLLVNREAFYLVENCRQEAIKRMYRGSYSRIPLLARILVVLLLLVLLGLVPWCEIMGRIWLGLGLALVSILHLHGLRQVWRQSHSIFTYGYFDKFYSRLIFSLAFSILVPIDLSTNGPLVLQPLQATVYQQGHKFFDWLLHLF